MKKNEIIIKLLALDKNKIFHENFIVKKNTTIQMLLSQNEIIKKLSFLSPSKNKIGVYGKIVSKDYILKNNDRVEMYESIDMDPKTRRRQLTGIKKKSK